MAGGVVVAGVQTETRDAAPDLAFLETCVGEVTTGEGRGPSTGEETEDEDPGCIERGREQRERAFGTPVSLQAACGEVRPASCATSAVIEDFLDS